MCVYVDSDGQDPRSGSGTQARIGKGSDNEWRIGKRIGIGISIKKGSVPIIAYMIL